MAKQADTEQQQVVLKEEIAEAKAVISELMEENRREKRERQDVEVRLEESQKKMMKAFASMSKSLSIV